MAKFKNWRAFSLVAWILITILTIVTMPDMAELVRDKGQIDMPKSAQSALAEKLKKNMSDNENDGYHIIVVHNSGGERPLTDQQRESIKAVNEKLKKNEDLGVLNVMSFADSKEVEKQLVSEDGTTILTQISINQDQGTIKEVTAELDKKIQIKDVKTYITGNGSVMEDFVQSTEQGVKKTEIIAVAFIIIVLILIFRSPIVPVISLLTVGISYIVSLSIIGQLVDHFNYPFSNFTQVFLVVILFGVGTDYNILLYTRFKEELGQGDMSPISAIKATFKSAGKTVIYSGAAVLVGFIALYLAEFKLYQAMSAVAVGVIVLLLVLITLNPFFMGILGKRMFWPVKKFEGHSDSKIWAFLSRHSVLRPFVALVFVVILSAPFIWMYSNELNYNDLIEVSDSFESKQGINVIEEHFPPGFSAPTELIIQSNVRLDNQQSLQAIDELTEQLSKVKGVSKVYSVTRPSGSKIKDLYISKQANTIGSGLGDAKDGVGEINDGLSTVNDELKNGDIGQLDKIQLLIDGTSEAKSGVSQLGDAIHQLSAGLNDGASGASELQAGLQSLDDSVTTLTGHMNELHGGYTELQGQLNAFSGQFDKISEAIEGAVQGYANIETSANQFVEAHPEFATDKNIQTILGISSPAGAQLRELADQLKAVTPQYKQAMGAFKDANSALAKVNQGLSQVKDGAGQLQSGASELNRGLMDGVRGSSQIAENTGRLETGLEDINSGQKQLLNGLDDLKENMKALQNGLSASTDGLGEISDGLDDVQHYLGDLSDSSASEKFYIPNEVLKGEDFKESLNMYTSDNRKSTVLTIVLDVNPYSKEAMVIAQNIEKQATGAIEGNHLKDVTFAVGGKSSANADLQDVAGGDFTRTATIMLIGIGIILMIITRSIMHPVFIIGSLMIAYYTSLGLSEWISQTILGMESLSWNVPFFSFIMIVALGVDYSIFLMMRFNELEGDQRSVIVAASRHIGGVVISAAIILGGTFAALIPSGVVTLIQVALVVIIGLVLLSFVMLPIFVPALISLQDKFTKKTYTKE